MTAHDLAVYVGTKDLAAAQDAWDAAVALVVRYAAGFGVVPPTPPALGILDGIPDVITARACLEVGAELYHRKNTKNGVSQFATADSMSPVRIARDPLVAARPLLSPFLTVGGFA